VSFVLACHGGGLVLLILFLDLAGGDLGNADGVADDVGGGAGL
jgi:hypothetical protein